MSYNPNRRRTWTNKIIDQFQGIIGVWESIGGWEYRMDCEHREEVIRKCRVRTVLEGGLRLE